VAVTINALLAVLDENVVLRADGGAVPAGASRVVHGARAVGEQALTFSRLVKSIQPVLVNGARESFRGFQVESCFRSWASSSKMGRLSKWTSLPILSDFPDSIMGSQASRILIAALL